MTDVAIQPESPEIPDKLYFRIGEVSSLLGVETYVLRYWETEFPTLAPKKSGTGHREKLRLTRQSCDLRLNARERSESSRGSIVLRLIRTYRSRWGFRRLHWESAALRAIVTALRNGMNPSAGSWVSNDWCC